MINLLLFILEKYVTFKCYEKVTNSHGKSLNLWAHRSVPRPGAGGLGSELVRPKKRKLEKDSQVKKEINKSWKS